MIHAGPDLPTAVFAPRTAVGTAHALVLAPVTPRWDEGAFFAPVIRTLTGAGLRVTVVDTLSLWDEEVDSMASFVARWRAVLPRFGPVDLLCGNALGGAVAQALLPYVDPATAALLVSGPARTDPLLEHRLTDIANLAAQGDTEAALTLLNHRVLPEDTPTSDTGPALVDDSRPRNAGPNTGSRPEHAGPHTTGNSRLGNAGPTRSGDSRRGDAGLGPNGDSWPGDAGAGTPSNLRPGDTGAGTVGSLRPEDTGSNSAGDPRPVDAGPGTPRDPRSERTAPGAGDDRRSAGVAAGDPVTVAAGRGAEAADAVAGRRLAAGMRLLCGIDVSEGVRAHRGPLLQIVGGRSQLVTRRHTAAAPHHTVHVAQGAGMRPHAEQPTEVAALVEAFLWEKGLR